MSGGIRARKGPSRPVLGAVSAVLLALTLGAGPGVAAPAGADEAGERIYRQGRLPDGSALVGEREASGRVEGPTAACVSCHRRSGLGVAWRREAASGGNVRSGCDALQTALAAWGLAAGVERLPWDWAGYLVS